MGIQLLEYDPDELVVTVFVMANTPPLNVTLAPATPVPLAFFTVPLMTPEVAMEKFNRMLPPATTDAVLDWDPHPVLVAVTV